MLNLIKLFGTLSNNLKQKLLKPIEKFYVKSMHINNYFNSLIISIQHLIASSQMIYNMQGDSDIKIKKISKLLEI